VDAQKDGPEAGRLFDWAARQSPDGPRLPVSSSLFSHQIVDINWKKTLKNYFLQIKKTKNHFLN
jgi:hypothetical protein